MTNQVSSSSLQAVVRVSVWNSKLAAELFRGVLNVSSILRKEVRSGRERSVVGRLLRPKSVLSRDPLHGLDGLGASALGLWLLRRWSPDSGDDWASLGRRSWRTGQGTGSQLMKILGEDPRPMSANPGFGIWVVEGGMSRLHNSRGPGGVGVGLSADSFHPISSGGDESRVLTIYGSICWD